MFGLLALMALGFVAVAVFGLLASVFAMIWWVLLLPFRLLSFVFRGFALVLALPFLALFALFGVLIFGAGVLAFALPFLPFALLVAGVVWLVKRTSPASPTRA